MIIQCTTDHDKLLIHYLEKEPVFNTFMLADIINYGFNFSHQQIYMEQNENGIISNVYLVFFNNLIIAGELDSINTLFIQSLLTESISIIMGKNQLIQHIAKTLHLERSYQQKSFYQLKDKKQLIDSSHLIQQATVADSADIFTFLATIPEFVEMYKKKEMIENRIIREDGIHLFIKEDQTIIGHVNSAAHSRQTSMIGGMAIHDLYRHKGLAKEMISAISRKILDTGRMPCIINHFPEETSLLPPLGFELCGYWGTIEIDSGSDGKV